MAFLAASLAAAQEAEVRRAEIEEYFSGSFPEGLESGLPVAVQMVEPGAVVTLQPGSYLARRFDAQPLQDSVPPEWRIDAPGSYRIRLPVDAIGASRDATVVGLQPVVVVEGGGLRYDGTAFRGSFLLGLEDRINPGQRHELADPVAFTLSAQADTIRPVELAIGHTNQPLERVRVVSFGPADSVPVDLYMPVLDSARARIWLPALPPDLRLTVSPERIQGFGLEVARLTITLVGQLGSQRDVVLSSDLAVPEPGRVTLDESGIAEATLRSRWIGTATITAERPGFASAEVPVQFVFPVRFLVAALLGGLVGGLLRWNRGARQDGGDGPDQQDGKRSPIARYIWGGLLGGLLVAIAQAVGINLAAAPMVAQLGLFNEAAVFVFGGIGAFYGLKLGERTG